MAPTSGGQWVFIIAAETASACEGEKDLVVEAARVAELSGDPANRGQYDWAVRMRCIPLDAAGAWFLMLGRNQVAAAESAIECEARKTQAIREASVVLQQQGASEQLRTERIKALVAASQVRTGEFRAPLR